MHRESKAEAGRAWRKTRPPPAAGGGARSPLSRLQAGRLRQHAPGAVSQGPTLTAPCGWGFVFCDCLLEILHFIFEFVFLQMKSNKTMEHVPMAWSLSPRGRGGSSPPTAPGWAGSRRLFHFLAPRAMPSRPFLPPHRAAAVPWHQKGGSRANVLGQGTRTPGRAPHPGLTAPQCISQVTWPLTPLGPGTKCLPVQKLQFLGCRPSAVGGDREETLWEGKPGSPAPSQVHMAAQRPKADT